MRDFIVAKDAQMGISNVIDGDIIAATILLQRMLKTEVSIVLTM